MEFKINCQIETKDQPPPTNKRQQKAPMSKLVATGKGFLKILYLCVIMGILSKMIQELQVEGAIYLPRTISPRIQSDLSNPNDEEFEGSGGKITSIRHTRCRCFRRKMKRFSRKKTWRKVQLRGELQVFHEFYSKKSKILFQKILYAYKSLFIICKTKG